MIGSAKGNRNRPAEEESTPFRPEEGEKDLAEMAALKQTVITKRPARQI